MFLLRPILSQPNTDEDLLQRLAYIAADACEVS